MLKIITLAVFIVLIVLCLNCWKAHGLPVRIDPMSEANLLLEQHPLIDGHNDLAMAIRSLYKNQFGQFNLTLDLANLTHTDLLRVRAGKLGGQFWAIYAPCATDGKDAFRYHLEQVELMRRVIDKYPQHLQFATTADEIRQAFANKKVASLFGMESGHAIESSLSLLRLFYDVGVRYMTLTHNCNTPWATQNQVDVDPNSADAKRGLTDFGRLVVKEMNRLGMLVDLSHTSYQTQLDALSVSRAPVIYSHSSVYALCSSTRNVKDDVLRKLV
jgi:membrane dipeptidase